MLFELFEGRRRGICYIKLLLRDELKPFLMQ